MTELAVQVPSEPGFPGQWQRVKGVLAEALGLDGGERESYLAHACAGDPRLLAEVRELVAAYEMTGPLDRLERRIREGAPPPGLQPGDVVGDFLILEPIGRGGMGAVHLGVREREGFSQRAAIKLLPGGVATPELIRRFHEERRILASLSHPNIALFIDGGVTPAGVPYFAMEHVAGRRIDEYVATRRPPASERLALFRAVCLAVRYAHGRLVVHRDLKPANILVTEDGQPKLLDFGIAGWTGVEPPPTDARRMTPTYASPEQVAGRPVGPASDIYQLGLLLREILTGRRPGDGEAQSSFPACRPSADLRAVLARCLETDPDRRYASVDGLLADLDRAREKRPVAARSSTRRYRALTFVRRHAVGLAVGTAVGAAVLGGLVSTRRQAIRAERAAEAAVRERDYAREVAATMTGMFAVVDPNRTPEQVGAVEVLDRAAADATVRLERQPELQSRLLHELGRVYFNMGLLDRSAAALETSIRIRRSTIDTVDAVLAEDLEYLGLVNDRRSRLEEAEANFREALTVRQALGTDSVALAAIQHELGGFLSRQAKSDEGIPLLETSLEIRRRVLPPGHHDTFDAVFELATAYHQTMQFDRSVELFEEAIAIGEAAPEETGAMVATSRLSLGTILAIRGDFGAAEPHVRRALEMRRALYGPDNGFTLEAEQSLALLLSRAGRYAEAIAALETLIPRLTNEFGAESRQVSGARIMLVGTLHDVGRYAAAAAIAGEAVRAMRATSGPEHPSVIAPLLHLGRALAMQGRADSARIVTAEARRLTKSLFGEGHAFMARCEHIDALAALVRGDAEAARSGFGRARDLAGAALRERHPDVLEARQLLGVSMLAVGETREALAELEAVLEIRQADQPLRHPDVTSAMQDYGEALLADGRYEEAASWLGRAMAGWDAVLPPDAWRRADVRSALGAALAGTGQTEEALGHLSAAAAGLRLGPGVEGLAARRARERLAAVSAAGS